MTDPISQFTTTQGQVAQSVGTAVGAITTVAGILSNFNKAFRAIVTADGDVISPDIVVDERSTDELVITEHPVEQGAKITDHAYKQPASLTLSYGWTQSSVLRTGPNALNDIYEQLRQLQVDRTLFQVFTGKRIYDSMLLKSLSIVTDKQTEYALMVRLECRQVLIAHTQTVTVEAKNQKSPKKTQSASNKGSKKPVPVATAP